MATFGNPFATKWMPKTLQAPKTATSGKLLFWDAKVSSLKRATMIQHFEADLIRAMGIVSPLLCCMHEL